MLQLPPETERLVRLMAVRSGRNVEDVLRIAIEREARVLGVTSDQTQRRMTVEQMLAMGAEIAAMPLLDKRSPNEIMNDLNDQ